MIEHTFANVSVDSAQTFRAIMQAMARPGTRQPVNATLSAPEPLLDSTAATALTLCDFQTPIWLGPGLDHDNIQRYLRFHTGAPIVKQPHEALFALLLSGCDIPSPAQFAQGTHEYPDRSATLIVQAAGLVGETVTLCGPGITMPRVFGVAELTQSFWSAMAINHAGFPLGVDAVFTAPGLIAALPRSTAILLKEAV